jgi:hypothetical protein
MWPRAFEIVLVVTRWAKATSTAEFRNARVYVNDSSHLRERAAEMRASSKELKHNNTAALIMRLADLYDPLADRAAARGDRAAYPKEQSGSLTLQGIQCSGGAGVKYA